MSHPLFNRHLSVRNHTVTVMVSQSPFQKETFKILLLGLLFRVPRHQMHPPNFHLSHLMRWNPIFIMWMIPPPTFQQECLLTIYHSNDSTLCPQQKYHSVEFHVLAFSHNTKFTSNISQVNLSSPEN